MTAAKNNYIICFIEITNFTNIKTFLFKEIQISHVFFLQEVLILSSFSTRMGEYLCPSPGAVEHIFLCVLAMCLFKFPPAFKLNC